MHCDQLWWSGIRLARHSKDCPEQCSHSGRSMKSTLTIDPYWLSGGTHAKPLNNGFRLAVILYAIYLQNPRFRMTLAGDDNMVLRELAKSGCWTTLIIGREQTLDNHHLKFKCNMQQLIQLTMHVVKCILESRDNNWQQLTTTDNWQQLTTIVFKEACRWTIVSSPDICP